MNSQLQLGAHGSLEMVNATLAVSQSRRPSLFVDSALEASSLRRSVNFRDNSLELSGLHVQAGLQCFVKVILAELTYLPQQGPQC